MKNVIIIGIARCGKTTLSHMVKEQFPKYNLIHSDTIKWGIIRGKGQEEYMRNNLDKQAEFESSEMFQKILLEFFNSAIRNDIYKDGHILESGQLKPSVVHSLIDNDNTIVVALGHGNLDENGIIDLCRTHDTKQSWTYNISDEELKIHAKMWANGNKNLKEECEKCNIKYFDTSQNRIDVLNEALGYIVKNID